MKKLQELAMEYFSKKGYLVIPQKRASNRIVMKKLGGEIKFFLGPKGGIRKGKTLRDSYPIKMKNKIKKN